MRPPGLHVLSRRCAAGDARLETGGLSIRATTPGEQSVVLFASVPLTREAGWKPLGEGELIAVRQGRLVAR